MVRALDGFQARLIALSRDREAESSILSRPILSFFEVPALAACSLTVSFIYRKGKRGYENRREDCIVLRHSLGDGCISLCGKSKFVVVTCSLLDDVPFFDTIVVPLFSELRMRETRYRKVRKYNKIEINVHDVRLFDELVDLGFPIGKKGQITIPTVFSRSVWKYIIAGIFATDGSFAIVNNNDTVYPRIEFRSISFPLLNQIREFLIRKDMRGNIYKTITRGFVCYRLEFPGKENLFTFKDVIGFVNPKHEERLTRYRNHGHLSWTEWSKHKNWTGGDLNPESPPCEGGVLPLDHQPIVFNQRPRY